MYFCVVITPSMRLMKHFQLIFRILLCIVILSSVLACRPRWRVLHQAQKTVHTQPEKVLHSLLSIRSQYSEMSDDEKARYGLLYAMALDKNSFDIDTVADMVDYSASYFDRKQKSWELAYSYLYKARILWYADYYAEALVWLLHAVDPAEQTGDASLLGKVYFDFGSICFRQNAIEKGIDYYNLAYIYFDTAKETDNMVATLTALSDICNQSGQHEKSYQYIQQALSITADSVAVGNLLFQMGSYYYGNENLDSAYHYVKKSLSFPDELYNLSIKNAKLADIYFDRAEYDSAAYYADMAINRFAGLETKRECYRILYNIASIRGDNELMSFNLSEYQACEDSIINHHVSQSKLPDMEQLHLAKKEVKKQRQEKKQLLVGVFIIAVLLLAGFYIAYREFKKRHARLAESVQASGQEKTALSRRAQLAKEINEAKLGLVPKNKLKLSNNKTENIKVIYKHYLCLDNGEMARELMNDLFCNIADVIQRDYPKVSNRELQYIFMFLMDATNEDICFALDYNAETLKRSRQYLKRKFKLSSTSALNAFFNAYKEF